MRKGNVRGEMVEGAVRLLAVEGLDGTSFAAVIDATGAPRGSVYHHFPGGKSELIHAALDLAGDRARAVLEETRGRPAIEVVEAFLDQWRQLLIRAKLRAGCSVMAVAAAPGDADLLEHSGEVFHAWSEHLSGLLVDGGLKPDVARVLSTLIIASTEGAIAICRAQRNRSAFETVATELMALVAAKTAKTGRARRTASTASGRGRQR
jgi:TetR/AcrR family transcriptional regulator, lmrAB and yxaGH operons repressor